MTTLNLAVGASGDDGHYSRTASNFDNSAGSGNLGGATNYSGFFRFTGVSGLSGSTVNSADFAPYFRDIGTFTSDVDAEDAAAPVAVSSAADGQGKTSTTAQVVWDITSAVGFNTVSITSVIQELADSYDSSAIQALVHSDQGTTLRFRTFDWGGSGDATLDIDYTAAAAGQPVEIRHQGVPTAKRDRPRSWN